MSFTDLVARSQTPRVDVTGSMSQAERDELDALCEQTGLSRREFATEALRQGLEQLRAVVATLRPTQ